MRSGRVSGWVSVSNRGVISPAQVASAWLRYGPNSLTCTSAVQSAGGPAIVTSSEEDWPTPIWAGVAAVVTGATTAATSAATLAV